LPQSALASCGDPRPELLSDEILRAARAGLPGHTAVAGGLKSLAARLAGTGGASAAAPGAVRALATLVPNLTFPSRRIHPDLSIPTLEGRHTVSSFSISGLGHMVRFPGRALDGGSAVEVASRRPAPGSRGARHSTKRRQAAMIGVLVATILTATGCCAGYCSSSAPPVGAGLQQHGQGHVTVSAPR
jgi:hypothetical protein